MSLDFHYDGPTTPRMSYRTTFPGLTMRIDGYTELFEVINISATGIAFKDPANRFSIDEVLNAGLVITGKVFLTQLSIKIVHTDATKNFVGIEFQNLTRSQETKLDVFILKLQKKEIEKQKRYRDEEAPPQRPSMPQYLENSNKSPALTVKDYERTGTALFEYKKPKKPEDK